MSISQDFIVHYYFFASQRIVYNPSITLETQLAGMGKKKNKLQILLNTKHTILEDSVLKICHQGGCQGAEFFPSLSGDVLKGRDILLCLKNNQEWGRKGKSILSDINAGTETENSRGRHHEP